MIEATDIKEGMKIQYRGWEWTITNVRLRYKGAWFRDGKGDNIDQLIQYLH